MIDNLKQKVKGIYGWSVRDGNIQPPTHNFPKEVKERADYFSEMMEDGLTFLGVVECIFAEEKQIRVNLPLHDVVRILNRY